MASTLVFAVLATALLSAACIGAGAGVLAATRVLARLTHLEAAAWSFAIGFGVVGWLVFFPGIAGFLHTGPLIALTILCATGTNLLRRIADRPERPARGVTWWALWLALALVLAVDLMEGLAPPADADTLAYHFALPKQFLAAGRIEFVPRAVDGAIPLLPQMTYLVALAIGGEMAMTLWSAVSGWMAGLLTYVVARRHLEPAAALAVALLFLSVPAVLYGGGTGQVETRLALFATVGAFALARAAAEKDLGFAAVAGLASGFFAAGKYTGLLYCAAAALALLVAWRSPRAFMVFCTAGLLAGIQWYGWNWWHTGDPVFPALFRVLDLPDGPYWTAAQDALFRAGYRPAETPLPVDAWHLFAYPFIATFAPPQVIDAGRTGLGPYGALLLPFVLAGIWHFRKRLTASPLFPVALIVAGFYLLWFVTAPSQRVRHLVPVWPLFLVCTAVAAVRWTEGRMLTRPLAAAIALTLTTHLGAQAIFGINYGRHLVTGESRAAFLARNVPFYDVIAPVEAALTSGDRVLVDQRQLLYLFDVPVFHYHQLDQAQVRFEGAEKDPAGLLRQLRGQRITHLLIVQPAPDGRGDLARASAVLAARGCAARVREFTGTAFASRTLAHGEGQSLPVALYALKEAGCPL